MNVWFLNGLPDYAASALALAELDLRRVDIRAEGLGCLEDAFDPRAAYTVVESVTCVRRFCQDQGAANDADFVAPVHALHVAGYVKGWLRRRPFDLRLLHEPRYDLPSDPEAALAAIEEGTGRLMAYFRRRSGDPGPKRKSRR